MAVVESFSSDYLGDPGTAQTGFDPRHRRIGARSIQFAPYTGPQFWGSIHPILPGGSMEPLRFLFNPNSIKFSYSSNPNILPQGALNQAQVNPSLPVGDSMTSIGFTLLFDRTYEIMTLETEIGVLTDILQLERLTGITRAQPVMHLTPVKLTLGHHSSFQYKALIKSFSVHYVQFNGDMIPTRCTVEVNSTRLSDVDPFASPEAVALYAGDEDEWRARVLEKSPTPQTAEPAKASESGGTNNAWVNAVGANGT